MKHCKTGSIDDWETFKRLRNAAKSAIRRTKAESLRGFVMTWLGIHLEHGSVRLKPYTKGFHVEEYNGW